MMVVPKIKKKVNLQLVMDNSSEEQQSKGSSKGSSSGIKQNLYLEEEEGPTKRSFKGQRAPSLKVKPTTEKS